MSATGESRRFRGEPERSAWSSGGAGSVIRVPVASRAGRGGYPTGRRTWRPHRGRPCPSGAFLSRKAHEHACSLLEQDSADDHACSLRSGRAAKRRRRPSRHLAAHQAGSDKRHLQAVAPCRPTSIRYGLLLAAMNSVLPCVLPKVRLPMTSGTPISPSRVPSSNPGETSANGSAAAHVLEQRNNARRNQFSSFFQTPWGALPELCHGDAPPLYAFI